MKKKIVIAVLSIFILGAGFTSLGNKDLEIVKNLDIFCTLFRELNMFYVDETPPDELITTGINSMLKSLDPYTVYIPEENMDDFNFQTTGEYGGIGSYIRQEGDYVIISEPYENFPAAKAGLRSGDRIIKIDATETKGLPSAKVSELLKGQPGTPLSITYERPYSGESNKVELIRERIVISNVPYYGMINENTGYIRLQNFTTNASAEVKAAFLELKENAGFNKLILDLRSNPGGLMIEAVRTCNLFIDKGETIVSTKGKVKKWDADYKTSTQPIDTEIPLVVLVNRGSASASEIVAGAMQDLDRAVIVGQRTFGKGLVQTTRPLKYNAQLKVTTAKYYIPSGRCIQALDYSNRNDDGSVGAIPDSLISEYQTKNGRLVYDGGGIQPDIEVVPENLSEITLRLYTEGMFFDFANKYRNTVESIAAPAEFKLADSEYKDFMTFVTDQDFEYETASEAALKKLINTAKREKYYDLSEDEFKALEEKLSHNNAQDMETFREEIEQILSEEIVERYYYNAGRIKAQLIDDIQLDSALNVVSHPVHIERILEGSEGSLARAALN